MRNLRRLAIICALALAALPGLRAVLAQTPAPFKPVDVKTGELKVVGGAFVPTPSFKPVELATAGLRVTGGALLPTAPPFAPVTIDTSALRVSGPSPAPKK
jgi:hypothetical protein